MGVSVCREGRGQGIGVVSCCDGGSGIGVVRVSRLSRKPPNSICLAESIYTIFLGLLPPFLLSSGLSISL